MTTLPKIAGYEIEILVQGFPGKSVENGGLGWSSIVLLRGRGRIALIDTGSFSVKRPLLERLKALGIDRNDVTDVLFTHAHYDHMMNWTLFPRAIFAIGEAELTFALADPIETSLYCELYVQALANSPQLRFLEPGKEALAGLQTLLVPGHTPHHLAFVLDGDEGRTIFAQDAVKNRAELLSEQANSAVDAQAASNSIAMIARLWREREGSILVPGHDLAMRNQGGRPMYIGERRAAVAGWFGEDLVDVTVFHLERHTAGSAAER